MKAQRKDVNTASTHITVRLKKGGAGKGQTRFEVLINRSAYPTGAAANKKEQHVWDMKEVVDEVFTNAAKLEPADKSTLEACFPNKSKKEIITEILDRGEAQTSEVDRAEHTVAQTEYFTKVAAAVSEVALMEERVAEAGGGEGGLIPTPASASSSSSATSAGAAAATVASTGDGAGGAGTKSKKDKEKSTSKKEKETASSAPEPATKATAASTTVVGVVDRTKAKYVHVTKEIVEREMKNARFRIIPGGEAKVTMDEQVNAAFLALSKNTATVKIIRDQHLWVIDAKKPQDAQDSIVVVEQTCGKKPHKILKQTTDKAGNTSITLLLPAEIKSLKLPAGVDSSCKQATHVPTSDDDDLSKFVPIVSNVVKTVASAPATAATTTAAATATATAPTKDGKNNKNNNSNKNNDDDSDSDNEGNKKGSRKSGKKASSSSNNNKSAAAGGSKKDESEQQHVKGKGGSLENDLAALAKKNLKKGGGGSDSDDSDSSEDSAPKMMVNKKKKK